MLAQMQVRIYFIQFINIKTFTVTSTFNLKQGKYQNKQNHFVLFTILCKEILSKVFDSKKKRQADHLLLKNVVSKEFSYNFTGQFSESNSKTHHYLLLLDFHTTLLAW